MRNLPHNSLTPLLLAIIASAGVLFTIGSAPWPSYWAEVIFGFTTAAVITYGLFKNKGVLQINALAIIPLLLLIPLFIQYTKGIYPYFGVFFIGFLYSVGFLLVLVTANGEENIKNKTIKDFIFYFFLISCVASFTFQIAQLLGIENAIIPRATARLAGTIGQPNILATFYILGIASVIYFCRGARLSKFNYAFIVIFSLGIGFTQSRTALINLILGSLVFFVFAKRDLRLLITSWFFIAISWLLPYFILTKSVNLTDSLREPSTGGGRLEIWHMAFDAILQHRWLGIGLGQISIAQYESAYFLPGRAVLAYTHNLGLDLLLWFGVFFGAVFFLYLLFVIVKFLALKNKTQSDWLIFYVLSAIFVHMLLEAPHSYAYLLLPFAVFLGIAISRIDHKDRISVNRLLFLTASLLLSCSALTIMSLDYRKIQSAIQASVLSSEGQTISPEALAPTSFVIFDNWQNLFQLFYAAPNTDKGQLPKIEALAALLPNTQLDAKVIYSLQESGRASEAVFRLMKACSMEPQPDCEQLKAIPFIAATVQNREAYCTSRPLSQSNLELSSHNTPAAACY